jgi:predicted transcriptional regulator of viral defense system
MKASDYISHLLSIEEYSFSWSELISKSSKSEAALKSELKRLVTKKEIINLRKGFYLIIPPRYKSFGRLPIELFINKLFQHLKKPYYVACLSAAKFHGASHQQIQKEYITTQYPMVRNIVNPVNMTFFTASQWPQKNIVKRKSDAGYFNLSSPVLTAVDLIHYQAKLGGLIKQFTVLEELAEEITKADLEDLIKWYPYKSTLQRLGFLLDDIQIGYESTSIIYEALNSRNFYSILLSPKPGLKAGTTGNRWKVDVNIQLESEL